MDSLRSPAQVNTADLVPLQGLEGWREVWSIKVLFSDDSTKFARLQQLTERKGDVSYRLSQLDRQQAEGEQNLQVGSQGYACGLRACR